MGRVFVIGIHKICQLRGASLASAPGSAGFSLRAFYKFPLPCFIYLLKSAAFVSTAEAPPARALIACRTAHPDPVERPRIYGVSPPFVAFLNAKVWSAEERFHGYERGTHIAQIKMPK